MPLSPADVAAKRARHATRCLHCLERAGGEVVLVDKGKGREGEGRGGKGRKGVSELLMDAGQHLVHLLRRGCVGRSWLVGPVRASKLF